MQELKFSFVVKETESGFVAVFRNDGPMSFGGGGKTRGEAIAKASLMLLTGLDLPPSTSSVPLQDG